MSTTTTSGVLKIRKVGPGWKWMLLGPRGKLLVPGMNICDSRQAAVDDFCEVRFVIKPDYLCNMITNLPPVGKVSEPDENGFRVWVHS